MRIALALLVLLLIARRSPRWWLLRGSLPPLDGERALPGLSAPVTIQRDALGVVTIDAANETDAMRALGYVHAQERFFEMDLMRRTAAGELSELFGAARARHRQGSTACIACARACRRDLDAIAGDQRAQLQAYVEGVNAGLARLRARPWPYLLLRQQPQPWRPEDTRAGRLRDVLRPAGREQRARTGAVEAASRTCRRRCIALLTHDGSELGCAADRRAARRRDAAGADELDLRELPMPAPARDRALPIRRRDSAATTSPSPAR